MELTLKNFRSFRGEHVIPLSELTFLVGENSSGKSSAMAAIAFALRGRTLTPNALAEEPYRLSSFSNLASDGEKNFSIGIRGRNRGAAWHSLHSTFREKQNTVVLEEMEYEIDGSMKMTVSPSMRRTHHVSVAYKTEDSAWSESSEHIPDYVMNVFRSEPVWHLTLASMTMSGRKERHDFLDSMRLIPLGREVHSIAPIRTKPQRTYEGSGVRNTPQGDHIPFTLRDGMRGKSKAAVALRQQIVTFGKETGLFDNITVKELQSEAGGVFQLLVEVSGHMRTLMDVGYGVSQVLPLLVECLLAEAGAAFCVQQPEVHLHPIGQAELASFYARMNSERKQIFFVESHSDYLLDRLRIEVRKGFDHRKIRILYFAHDGEQTSVKSITLDDQGNFVGAPLGFRDFFLREQAEILGLPVDEGGMQ